MFVSCDQIKCCVHNITWKDEGAASDATSLFRHCSEVTFTLFCTRLLPVSVFNYFSVNGTIMYHILCTFTDYRSLMCLTEQRQVYYDALVHLGLA